MLLAIPASGFAREHKLTIYWGNNRITFIEGESYPNDEEEEESDEQRKMQIVDCAFFSQRTKCETADPDTSASQPFGWTYAYVPPIAIFPGFLDSDDVMAVDAEQPAHADLASAIDLPPDATQEQRDEALEEIEWRLDDIERERPDWKESARNPLYVAALPEIAVYPVEQSMVDDMTDWNIPLGWATEGHGYSPVAETTGGDYVLGLWRSLINKRPRRLCARADDYCSVVVRATYDRKPALAYCAILNSEIGLGSPFSCQVVAYQVRDRWWIYSYTGPAECEGCGAGGGASCTFESGASRDQVVAAVIESFKEGRTNIELKPVSTDAHGTVRLAGQNIATPSRFYRGYYDKAYAIYHISESPVENGNRFSIEGLYNLLISVEPSRRGIDYREIGTASGDDAGDLQWFQSQIQAVITDGFKRRLSIEVDCSMTVL